MEMLDSVQYLNYGFWIAVAIVVLVVLRSSVQFVPQNRAYIVDGKSTEAASAVVEAVAIVSAMNKSDAFSRPGQA